jgi:hypothetical protein
MSEQLALFDAGVFDRPDASVSVNCLDSDVNTAKIREAYMVRDELWLRVNPGRAGMLCIGCLEMRLSRRLTRLDFTSVWTPASRRLLQRLGSMVWRPDLPEPRPAVVGPEPVPLEVLRRARALCANFRVPPRQFRRRTKRGAIAVYYPASDIVAVDRERADMQGLGGDDGYYATLLHELLHATGHRRRLGRETTGDYSADGSAREEGTVVAGLRLVLEGIGFPAEALDWHAPKDHCVPVDTSAAVQAAEWMLARRSTRHA